MNGQGLLEKYSGRLRVRPYPQQAEDSASLLEKEAYALFSEMGTGKTKTVIDAACVLAAEGRIKGVLVVCPAAVKSVWASQDFGEIKKHSWMPGQVWEYHSKTRQVWQEKEGGPPWLSWVVTNYEYIRSEEHRERLESILKAVSPFMMVLDESAFIKSRTAAQTKACIKLGARAERRVILNGTPIANSPLDLWSQMRFLGPDILPFKNFFHFRSEFAVMGGFQGRQVVQWKNLDRLQELVAPYAVRREKSSLGLPPKLDLPPLEVPLSEETWDLYRQMRDDAVAWLGQNPSLAAQAGVRIMRLAQITAGFLGGIVGVEGGDGPPGRVEAVREIGCEKLDAFREWVGELLEDDPHRKIVAWCRFRPELERCAADLRDLLPTYRFYGQGKKERREAEAAFSGGGVKGPALLCAQPQAGGLGQNWTSADAEAYLSNDYSLWYRKQSEDRLHRGGQTKTVLVQDFLAVGPKGQRTVDHTMVKAVKGKEDISKWTCAAWIRALEEE